MLDLGWPFARHLGIFAGTQNYAQERGNWQCHIDEFAHIRLPARRTKKKPYDGIIARATSELAERAKKCGIPVVNVWWNSPVAELPKICPDIVSGGQLAAEHLMQRGYRNFACLARKRIRSHRMQMDRFRSTVEASGFDCQVETSTGDYPVNKSSKVWHGFERKIEVWIDSWKPPIGVFLTHEDITARHVAVVCQRRGLQFPDDVGLVVCLSEKSILLNPSPALTSVECDYERVGYQAAQLLDRLMDGEPAPKEPLLLDPVKVIARESTGFISTDDDLVSEALRFINQHANKPIGVEHVVRSVYGSRRTLERRFRDCLGRSVASEIRRLRVERAKQFLRDTDLSSSPVAMRCGFTSAQSLCEIFLRETGMTPGEFRRRNGPGENQ
jgi:LacI family transcriptional regulator